MGVQTLISGRMLANACAPKAMVTSPGIIDGI